MQLLFLQNHCHLILKSEILDLIKPWDVIRKGCLQDYKVLIPDDKNSDDDGTEDITEGEKAKIMVGKVGTKKHR